MDKALRGDNWGGTPKHVKAMRVHRLLAILYGALGLVFAGLMYSSTESQGAVFLLLVMAVPAAIHALIAFGAAGAQPWAKVLSIIAGVLMLAGVPVGTLIGIYLLRNADWKKQGSEA